MASHNFGENQEEYSSKRAAKIPVIQSAKYKASRDEAVKLIDTGKYGVRDSDFWILMNETKSGKMMYTGLIISHNACLKINDALDVKFRPECVSVNQDGYNHSLVFTYCCPEQGLYEVGEASAANCKNAYPYAMAFKRLFDRVVLKLSKLAYSGVYSEAEADEFRAPQEDEPNDIVIENPTAEQARAVVADVANSLSTEPMISREQIGQIQHLMQQKHVMAAEICDRYKVRSIEELTYRRAEDCIRCLLKSNGRA